MYQGLDLPAVESLLRMQEVENHAETLRQLKHMERAALPELNRKRA